MRGTYDHTGLSDARSDAHDNRLMYPGMMRQNKKEITVFPFNFKPMHYIRERHIVEKQEDADGGDLAVSELIVGRPDWSFAHVSAEGLIRHRSRVRQRQGRLLSAVA